MLPTRGPPPTTGVESARFSGSAAPIKRVFQRRDLSEVDAEPLEFQFSGRCAH
jgi:hypothetical protein